MTAPAQLITIATRDGFRYRIPHAPDYPTPAAMIDAMMADALRAGFLRVHYNEPVLTPNEAGQMVPSGIEVPSYAVVPLENIGAILAPTGEPILSPRTAADKPAPTRRPRPRKPAPRKPATRSGGKTRR